MTEYICVNCGRTFVRFNVLQRKCGLCSYNLTAKKPMKRIGKVTKDWINDRKQWVKDNPPDYRGYWECALKIAPDCLNLVDIDQLQVDHIKSRTRSPENRRKQSNLQPSCAPCNKLKGSK